MRVDVESQRMYRCSRIRVMVVQEAECFKLGAGVDPSGFTCFLVSSDVAGISG